MLSVAFDILQILWTEWRERKEIKITGERELLMFRRRLITYIMLAIIRSNGLPSSNCYILKVIYILLCGSVNWVQYRVSIPYIQFERGWNYKTCQVSLNICLGAQNFAYLEYHFLSTVSESTSRNESESYKVMFFRFTLNTRVLINTWP